MDLVVAAEGQLTAAQKNKIEQHYKKVANNANNSERSSSPTNVGEGPSKIKGKGIDPSNWGNIDLDKEELDPKVQQIALESLKQDQL